MTVKMVDYFFLLFDLLMQFPGVSCGLLCLTVSGVTLWRWQRKRRMEVIVFSRYPTPGKTKTRMVPVLGEVGASLLQTTMTEHIMKNLVEANVKMKNQLNLTMQYNGGTEAEMCYWLDNKMHGVQCAYRPQADGSLGDKLKLAVRESIQRGNKQVIVIGADIPGIKAAVIQDAFAALASSDQPADMVIGPAQDGGYYLIGFTSRADRYLDDIFLDIDWGTDKVFAQQVSKAKHLGITMSVLPQVLSDVDTEEDLMVFEKEVGVARQQLTTGNWSIIMPVLNEGRRIADTLADVLKKCHTPSNIQEIIVSDGGSSDDTVEKVKSFSTTSAIPVRIINSKPGRGFQQIAGAEAAKGDNFLFLHADTKLPQDFDESASKLLQTPGIVAGAFEFYLDFLADEKLRASESRWFRLQMEFLTWTVVHRAKKFELPYGDQALFMSRRAYREVGGFPPFYLMEDFVLVKKLQKIGHVGIVDGHRALTSYRRWKKYGGYLRVSGFNQMVLLAYKCGVHPNTLARWYYGKRLKTD